MLTAIDDHYGQDDVDGESCERILRAPRYVQGQFDDPEGYRRLAETLDELDRDGGTRGNRMFYLATPPSAVPGHRRAARRGRARPARRLRRRARARRARPRLDAPRHREALRSRPRQRRGAERARSARVFDERQVCRIDHYLAKETVQNLLVLRFANGIFEPVWNRRYVDHVQITAAETLGVEHRGPYYEEAGALRDMIKPHLVQLFSLVAMESPVAFDADAVRDEKLKVLRAVRPIPPDRVDLFAVRGQYVAGSRSTARRRSLTAPRSASPPTRRPRRSPPSSCSSTTGAGRGCRSTCAPASAWRRRSPRSPSSSGGRR